MQPNDQDRTDTSGPESQDIPANPQVTPDSSSPSAPQPRRADFPTDEDLVNPQTPQTTPPDYLGLTPVEVTPPPQPKSKKGLVIGLIILVTILIVGGVLAWMMTRPSLEDKLYGAIENLMTAQKISGNYNISLSGVDGEMNLTTESDLSDYTKPKVYAKFTYNTDTGDTKIDTTGDIYRDDSGTGYIRFSKLNTDLDGDAQGDIQMNKWYKVPSEEQYSLLYKMYKIISIDSMVHNLVQQLIVYGTPTDKAGQITEIMRQKQLYSIVSTKSESSVTKFTVKMKSDNINKINEEINKILGTDKSVKLITTTSKNDPIELWVDDKSGLITKVVYTEHTSKGSVASVLVDVKYSYQSSQVRAPSI